MAELKRQNYSVKDIPRFTLVTSTPVIPSTVCGILTKTSKISPVSLAAPTSPLPDEIIVTFLALDRGAAISAATWRARGWFQFHFREHSS